MVKLGLRVRAARVRLGITQAQLAERAGFGHAQTVSDIERGQRQLKAADLARLARALFVSYADLLGPLEDDARPHVVWRRKGGTSAEAEARLLLKSKQYRLVEQLTGNTARTPLPKAPFGPNSGHDEAGVAAERFSQLVALGSIPASSLSQVLEEILGIKLWFFSLEDSSSAASVVHDDLGHVILVNRDEAPWRRNFSVAHELFHLLTWEYTVQVWDANDDAAIDQLEKYAEGFASSLLLPADSLIRRFNASWKGSEVMSYQALVEMAREFQVSTEALLWRLSRLGCVNKTAVEDVLSDPTFRGLDRSSMGPHWRNPMELPGRFVRLAFFAYEQGDLAKARLAEFLDTNLVDLSDKLSHYELYEDKGYEKTMCTS